MSRENIAINSNMIHELNTMNLDYEDKNNISSIFTSEGNIHPYPAKAVPNMVYDLIFKLKEMYDIKTVLDPFVGSGTVALEAKILGLDFYGSDLNPLAVLLSRTKSLTIKGTSYIRKKLDEFIDSLSEKNIADTIYFVEDFKNINYWFKSENIKQLSYINRCIDIFLKKTSSKYKESFSLIVLTAFSATIRESSLTRNDEFKLYRLSPADIKKFDVNSIKVFGKCINELLNMIQDVTAALDRDTVCEIFLADAKEMSYMNNVKADLIITSPPYGDSASTVAYGQFSRLSLQWMGDLLEKYLKIETYVENCDEYLLGGKHSVSSYNDNYLNMVINCSETLSKLVNDAEKLIKEELQEFELAKEYLLRLQKQLLDSLIVNMNDVVNNSILYNLIRERIRLYIYRKINKNTSLLKKQVKELTIIQTDKVMSELFNGKSRKNIKRIELLRILLRSVLETINRKIKSLPQRKVEVLNFFIDLYQVIQQSNDVISDEGIQVWIVGHRTVLGSIEVKMANILLEWFEHINYQKIALIKRNYHFKRLPHHINSTATRKKEVKTMMEEYILIVRKNMKSK